MNSQDLILKRQIEEINRAKQVLEDIFPLTKDPTIFLGILELLKNTLINLKKITSHDKQTTYQLNLILDNIIHILSTHQKCPIQIKTKNKIIMYTDQYDQKITLTEEDLRQLITEISIVIEYIKKNHNILNLSQNYIK